jgi:hypothetical protein
MILHLLSWDSKFKLDRLENISKLLFANFARALQVFTRCLILSKQDASYRTLLSLKQHAI